MVQHQLAKATLEDGAVYEYRYDSNQNLTHQTDPLGNQQRASYGAYNRLK